MEFGEPGVYSSAGVSGGQCLFAMCYQPLHHVWHLWEQDQCMCMRTFVCLHAKSFTRRTVMNVALCSGVGCWNIGIRRRACRFGHFCVVAENDEQVSNLWPLSVACVTGHVGIVYGLQAMEAPGQTKLFSASYDKTLRVCHPYNFKVLRSNVKWLSCDLSSGLELGSHDLCADTHPTWEQCHLPGLFPRQTLFRISGQYHQGKEVVLRCFTNHPGTQHHSF